MTPEVSLRKPEFDLADSVGVELADGQTWHLKRPRLTMRIHVDHDGKPVMRGHIEGPSAEYGPWLDELEEMAGTPTPEAFERYLILIASLAVALLRENYRLPDAMVPDLFAYDGSPECLARWARLRMVVSGTAPPKAPAGDGSSSEPAPAA